MVWTFFGTWAGAFVIGLIVGLLVEWVVDWLYWRRREGGLRAELEAAQAANKVMQTDLDGARAARRRAEDDLAGARAERDKFKLDLDACTARRRELDLELGGLRTNLETCSQQRRELELDRDGLLGRVRELEPLQGQIATLQAEQELLRTQAGEVEPLRAELRTLRAEKERLSLDGGQSRILGSGETISTLGLTSTGITLGGGADNGGELEGLRGENARLRDELAATRQAIGRLGLSRRDPLIDIDGIGPVYQDRLYDAGIVSFEQLAALGPEGISAIIGASGVQRNDYSSWIEQARVLAGRPIRDALIDINGIGPVYEQRLFAAGIYTFEQLCGLSPERIKEIIGPDSWQSIDPAAWIAEARDLAAKVRAGSYRKGDR